MVYIAIADYSDHSTLPWKEASHGQRDICFSLLLLTATYTQRTSRIAFGITVEHHRLYGSLYYFSFAHF
jgi:hypothetical protein